MSYKNYVAIYSKKLIKYLEYIDEHLFTCGGYLYICNYLYWLEIMKEESNIEYFFDELSGGMHLIYAFSDTGSPWKVQQEKDEYGEDWERACKMSHEWNKFGSM